MMAQELIKRLTKPHAGDSTALVYYEVFAYDKDGEKLPSKYFIEDENARAYQLAHIGKGNLPWKYCRAAYQLRAVENLKFEDE